MPQIKKEGVLVLFDGSNFYNRLKVSRGYILKSDGYHEKGVDVQIAADLLIGAYEDLWDTTILLSSDTDLLPSLRKVRELGKNIEYVGFSHSPSFAMIRHATLTKLLSRDDFLPFSFLLRSLKFLYHLYIPQILFFVNLWDEDRIRVGFGEFCNPGSVGLPVSTDWTCLRLMTIEVRVKRVYHENNAGLFLTL